MADEAGIALAQARTLNSAAMILATLDQPELVDALMAVAEQRMEAARRAGAAVVSPGRWVDGAHPGDVMAP